MESWSFFRTCKEGLRITRIWFEFVVFCYSDKKISELNFDSMNKERGKTRYECDQCC